MRKSKTIAIGFVVAKNVSFNYVFYIHVSPGDSTGDVHGLSQASTVVAKASECDVALLL